LLQVRFSSLMAVIALDREFKQDNSRVSLGLFNGTESMFKQSDSIVKVNGTIVEGMDHRCGT
jgi:hypothetical protein